MVELELLGLVIMKYTSERPNADIKTLRNYIMNSG
jgi:hypothetical protein